jgi:hypothetical protein
LRVGQRVLTDGNLSEQHPTAVDEATWRHLRLEGALTFPDGTEDPVVVETLQRPEWIAANRAHVGAIVPLPVDLVDMGLPEDLRARVVSNEKCPPIANGLGQVVLSTVNHLNPDVRELTLRAADGRIETLRPTAPHKFYSETRGAWVSVMDLRYGERLRGVDGTVALDGQRRVPGRHRVYNMTVETDHVYRVSQLGILVHNNWCEKIVPPTGAPPGFSNPGFGQEVHQRFQDLLAEQTHTSPDDWFMRTAPGMNGVDAEYIGPASSNPGFKYAELKPYSGNGVDTFFDQLFNWRLPPEETSLWFYNPHGVIGWSGYVY